ncbi:MAG: DPP IV N-terminal domain-containing protein [Planctomycetota bacterium]
MSTRCTIMIPTAASCLLLGAALGGCGAAEPVVRLFTGQPDQPLRPVNEPRPTSTSHTGPFPVGHPVATTTRTSRAPVIRRAVAEPEIVAPPPPPEVFPTRSLAYREPGMTAPQRFGVFGGLPSSTAPGYPANTGFDDAENLTQVSFASEGRNFDPAVSPDGAMVYFASTRHAPTADIYAQQIGSTAVTKLTTSAAHDVMPAVSPDGDRIAFASNRNGSYDIYITNSDGGGQAAQITADSAHELHPTWSADGTLIAYCRLSNNSDRWEIWVADAINPGIQTFLTYGLFPDWHPTENRILYQRSRDRGDRYFSVWTIDYVDGEALAPTELASSSVAAVINPSWSHDGEFIAFSTILNPEQVLAGEPQVADLWVSKADGTQRANLTGGFFANLMPDWTPRGELVFISDRAGIENIWSVRPGRAIQAASIPGGDRNSRLADVPVESE